MSVNTRMHPKVLLRLKAYFDNYENCYLDQSFACSDNVYLNFKEDKDGVWVSCVKVDNCTLCGSLMDSSWSVNSAGKEVCRLRLKGMEDLLKIFIHEDETVFNGEEVTQ